MPNSFNLISFKVLVPLAGNFYKLLQLDSFSFTWIKAVACLTAVEGWMPYKSFTCTVRYNMHFIGCVVWFFSIMFKCYLWTVYNSFNYFCLQVSCYVFLLMMWHELSRLNLKLCDLSGSSCHWFFVFMVHSGFNSMLCKYEVLTTEICFKDADRWKY